MRGPDGRIATADRTLLLSVDFEDWHQRALRDAGVDGWDTRYPAFVHQTEALLSFLDEIEAKATFFLLGMTAKNYPRLVEDLLARGHDTASHGFAHRRVYRQTPDEFRSDLEESVAVIKELTGRAPRGYRAPAFSLNRDTVWAYSILSDLGFTWDSSQFDSPRIPRRLRPIPQSPYVLFAPGGGRLLELPLAALPVGRGPHMPIGGGTYWRFLPTAVVESALGKGEEAKALYFHPFEFDPGRLWVKLPRGSSAKQRALVAYRYCRANPGRSRLRASLRCVARDFRLASPEQEIDILRSRFGERTRSLSEEGELV